MNSSLFDFLNDQRRPQNWSPYEGSDHDCLKYRHERSLAPIDGSPATFLHHRQDASIPLFDRLEVLPRLQTKYRHLRTTPNLRHRTPHVRY
jgi:hypothetical protein